MLSIEDKSSMLCSKLNKKRFMLNKIRKTLREKRLEYLTTNNKPLSIAIALLIFSLFAIATPLISMIMFLTYIAAVISVLVQRSERKQQDKKSRIQE